MNNELYHFGVKGMHWGVRRNEDKIKKGVKSAAKLGAGVAIFGPGIYVPNKTGSRYNNPAVKKSALQEAHKSAQKRYNTYKKELDSINKVYDQHVQKRDYYRQQYQKNGDRHSKVEYKRYNNAVIGMDGAKEFYIKKINDCQEEMRQISDAMKVYHDSFNDSNELYHFGVKGMKWGQRRYQNQDGSYTAQGRGRYDPNGSSSSRSSRSSSGNNHARLKKAAKIGAGVAAAGLAAYGGYRLAKSGKLSGLSSGVKSAASRARGSNVGRKVGGGARRVANKVGNSGVGRRVKRGVNSAQYHATRIKNEMAYRRATGGGRNVRSNVIGIGGPTYSRAGAASYRVRSAARSLASGARKAPGAAKRVAKAPVNAHKKFTNWAFTNTGSRRRNFGRGLVYGGAHGLAFDAAVVGAAVHQGRKANKRYKNANSNKKRR